MDREEADSTEHRIVPGDELWERSTDLAQKLLELSSGLDIPRGGYWPTLVTVTLDLSNRRLLAICKLLEEGDSDSSVILTRSLFELVANLRYISKDVEARLPEYLRHGLIPLTRKEVERARSALECKRLEGKDLVPRRAWRNLKNMCSDLGPWWMRMYETFYAFASVPTHAGSFTLSETFIQLLEQESVSDRQKAIVLATASIFHVCMLETAAMIFPSQIDRAKIENMSRSISCVINNL